MIGSLLAMRFYAKKPWFLAFAFWAVYLIVGIVFGTMILNSLPTTLIFVGGIAFSFIVFVGLAIYWLRLAPMISIIAFAVAYVIDYVIMMMLATVGFSLGSLL